MRILIRQVFIVIFVFISGNISLIAQEQLIAKTDSIDRYAPTYQAKQHINYRGNLNNSRLIFEKKKAGRVAFLGGSITEMKGWRTAVIDELKHRFPETKFDFVSAGIGSTGSTPGTFRLENDVLSKGKIDLLFVEAAVNDHVNGFNTKEQLRGMEGIIRQALKSNRNIDIIMQHFICEAFIPVLNRGEMPATIVNHEKVADYYQIPSINQAKEIAERMKDGEFDWKKFGGIHPAPFGHSFYIASVKTLFDKMWATKTVSSKIAPHALPSKPIDKFSYHNAQLIDPAKAVIKNDWMYESAWKPKVEGVVRRQYQQVNILEALMPGAELSFEFEGTAVGIYTLCGPDAGILEYSIDGGKFKQYNLFTKWSKNLYLPWVCMFETELIDKKHIMTLRMSAEKNPASKGTACQIYYFAVNGSK